MSKCSGHTFYTDIFYALYDTFLTNLAILWYTIFDQDVSWRMTGREEGLPYKLYDYYRYCRDRVINRTFQEYWYYFVYSFVSCVAIYFVTMASYRNKIVSEEG